MGKCIVRPFYTPHQLRHDHDDILFINEHWGEIKEAYFQVLEALKAPTIEQPSTPTPEGGCKCPWVKKTLIPTYFYITLDDTAEDLTDSDVEDIIKNTDVTVLCDELLSGHGASIPKQFPLIYLGKTAEGYKYAFPYSLDDTRNDSTGYDEGHEKSILIQLHNRLSQYNTENSPWMHGVTKTNGTRIYRASLGGGGSWPATNKIILSIASEYYHTPQDRIRVYFYKHRANEIEPVPMTFEFLETVRQCATEEEDKPDINPDTPDDSTPEGVLTPYTVKVRFTPECWYVGDAKYAVYCFTSNGEGFWKEAVKVENNVVWYTFTEEEVNSEYSYVFTSHNLEGDVDWSTNIYQTADIEITFDDTVRNDVVTIEHTSTTAITVGSAYV